MAFVFRVRVLTMPQKTFKIFLNRRNEKRKFDDPKKALDVADLRVRL